MKTQNEHPARSIKVIGVGGAGVNIVAQLMARGLAGLQFAVLNTDNPADGAEFFALEARRVRSLDAASAALVDVVLAEHSEKLSAWFAGADVVFVVTGLGGKTGSGLSPAVARLAKNAGALVLGFAGTPFEFEGGRRMTQAQRGLEQLRAVADGVVCLPNRKITRLIDENTGVLDAFRLAGELLADGAQGVWRLLSCHGLIEIHFEDLRDLIRAGRTENLFAAAEASGPNRVREVVEKLIAHPLLDSGRALSTAGSVLVSLVGGPGLTLAEVNRVMEQINRQCEGAQVLMGAAIDAAFADRLAVTVIAAARENAVVPEVSPVAMGLNEQMLDPQETLRPASRFVPPPPSLTAEKLEELAGKKSGGRGRRNSSKMRQEQLPLEIISKGRFDKSEPTVRNGEDLDQPTFIRRGLVLN